jgi:large subunit ribosomal protein L25
MDSLALSARPRTETGRHVRALRRAGHVPAVVYGHRQDSLPITADLRSVERLWRRAGRSHLIDLTVEGQPSRKVLIREMQISPRTGRVVHADFLAVNLREKLQVDVPLMVVGESPAVTDTKVGQLLQTVNSIRVECLPGDIPAQLTVDISGLLEVDAHITLGEIELPKGVTLVNADPDETVVKISPLRVREEEEEAAPAEVPEGEAEAAPAEGEAAEAPAAEATED